MNINNLTIYTKPDIVLKTIVPSDHYHDGNKFKQWLINNKVTASIAIYPNKIYVSINHVRKPLPEMYEQSKKGAVLFLLKWIPKYVRSLPR